MSIIALKKVLLAAPAAHREQTLDRLQSFGSLHLQPLGEVCAENDNRTEHLQQRISDAIAYLKRCSQRLSADPGVDCDDLHDVVDRTLALRRERRRLHDRIDELDLAIRQLKYWGEFRLPEADTMRGRRFWFYRVPASRRAALDELKSCWRIVHSTSHTLHLVIVAKEQPAVPPFFQQQHPPAQPLHELRARRRQCQLELEDLGLERVRLTRWIAALEDYRRLVIDGQRLREARRLVLDEGAFFVIAAWLPEPRLDDFVTLCRKEGWGYVINDGSPTEQPPTLLTNPEWLGGGTSLMRFFQLPGYWSWDPTPVVFFSFALFFALILADAGYALVLGLGLLLARPRWRRRPQARQIDMMLLTVMLASLSFGMAAGSYFGTAPPADSPLARIAVVDLHNFDAMMRLSIGVGVAHLLIANIMRGLALWPMRNALSSWGWVAVCVAGYAYWLAHGQVLPGVLASPSIALGALGALAVFWYDDPEPLRSSRDVWRRLFSGGRAIAKVSKVFGDVLSYMRLFALGLASATLALTFNQLAESVVQQMPGIGLVFAALLLVVGHFINLVLAVMGGVVHGMRLILIEFFAWALDQEGYPFEPFRKEEAR